jgi:hypothetical protein
MRSACNAQPRPDMAACIRCTLPFLLLCIWLTSAFAEDLARTSGWVVIPVNEYRELRAKAFPTEANPEPPPVDATLTRVDYDLKVAGDLGSGRALLTIDVLKDGWVRVPVPAGLLVREAHLDGKLVSLVPTSPGKGGYQLSILLSHEVPPPPAKLLK